MKKFITKVFAYLIVFFVLGNVVAFACQYFLARSQFYKPNYVVNALDKNETYDYFLLGSSRGLTTIDTKQVDGELGTSGLNLSMDDTDLKTQLLMLKHFYASGYQAKNCILALDLQHYTKTDSTLGNNDYRFFAYADRDYINEHYTDYETGIVRPLSIAGVIPFAALSYYNLELFMPSGLAATKPQYSNRFDDKGNYSYPNNLTVQASANRNSRTAVTTNPLLAEMKAICEKNNTQLVFYIAPYLNESQQVTTGDLKVPLINHSDLLVGTTEFFYDGLHVNSLGRTKVTEEFTKQFREVIKK